MSEIQGRHNVILENRSHLVLSGVTDVDSFNETEIALFTQLGELKIKGIKFDCMPVKSFNAFSEKIFANYQKMIRLCSDSGFF